MFLLCIYNTENHIYLTIKLNLDDKYKKIYKIKKTINVIYLYFYKFFFTYCDEYLLSVLAIN
jgi:hypothetical protein